MSLIHQVERKDNTDLKMGKGDDDYFKEDKKKCLDLDLYRHALAWLDRNRIYFYDYHKGDNQQWFMTVGAEIRNK